MSDPEQRMDRRWRKEGPRRDGWRKQEKRAADVQPGGRQQPGSGSGKGASKKGDARGDYLLVSSKTTEKKGIRIEREWLESIRQQAWCCKLIPALYFGFDSEGAGRDDWLALPDRPARYAIEAVAAVNAGDFERARVAAQMFLLG